MRIAVYPGSFDPLHIGHLAILRALGQSSLFDCTYLLVSPQNPLKIRSTAASALERTAAAQAALARHPELNARLDEIELSMAPPTYTIRTLDALQEREPGNDFTLVMGADNLAQIRRWRDYGRILSEFGVAVYPRKGFDLDAMKLELLAESGDYRIEVLDAPLVDISSTEIRNTLSEGKDVSGYLM